MKGNQPSAHSLMPQNRKIFLVDDETSFTDLMATLLETGTGMPVCVFNHPRAALAALDACEPVFVVSDLVMPDLNGFEFLREVARKRPSVPCVLVTGNHLDPAAVETQRTHNLIGVLFKPVSWRDIALLIREHAAVA